MGHFKNGNDARLATRVWHAYVWKTYTGISQIEAAATALEVTRIHRPRRLRTDGAFVGWFKWLLRRVLRDGASWRDVFEAEYDDRMEVKRLNGALRRIEDAEELRINCPYCGLEWELGDQRHGCANWAWRKRDQAIEQREQRRKALCYT